MLLPEERVHLAGVVPGIPKYAHEMESLVIALREARTIGETCEIAEENAVALRPHGLELWRCI